MIHYVDRLSVDPIKINGIDTATYSKEQNALCGITIKIKQRSDFTTNIGPCDCPLCIERWRERSNKPFDCKNCSKVLEWSDIILLRPQDAMRLCGHCRITSPHLLDLEND